MIPSVENTCWNTVGRIDKLIFFLSAPSQQHKFLPNIKYNEYLHADKDKVSFVEKDQTIQKRRRRSHLKLLIDVNSKQSFIVTCYGYPLRYCTNYSRKHFISCLTRASASLISTWPWVSTLSFPPQPNTAIPHLRAGCNKQGSQWVYLGYMITQAVLVLTFTSSRTS